LKKLKAYKQHVHYKDCRSAILYVWKLAKLIHKDGVGIMDNQQSLFSHKQEIQWKAEASRRKCSVRQELLADGTYFVAYISDGSSESVVGLFKRSSDGGGYFARGVNKVHSAKMILKSYKLDIAAIGKDD